MSDLTRFFNNQSRLGSSKPIDPPDIQLRDAIIEAGLTPPDYLEFDGKIHRFNSGTKGKPGFDKAGWYVAFGDGVPAGRFGCWRAGVEITWCADIGRRLTHEEELAHLKRMSEARAIREADQAARREAAEDEVSRIWIDCIGASADHPYLQRKGIGVHGARVTGDGRLVVPLYDEAGGLSSLQYIDHSGGKLYHPGGVVGGKFWSIGTDDAGPIYIAEGFATAATIYEATKRKTFVAYSASNIPKVLESLRVKYPTHEIIIVADNDKSGVGMKYADQASAKFGARVVMTPIEGDANDYVKSGHDLALILHPPKDEWLIAADEFSHMPAPISWMVKGWVQDSALVMVHGPSGSGKTFIVLDWCLHIATGKPSWMGKKVKPGPIVYLAGEGHHGLRGRVAAWRQHHGIPPSDMWISKSGCDLNTPEGLLRAIQSIRQLPKIPRAIVVDTLHRFLFGDENSAQDAKTMLDACAALMKEFGCTVILVHHTGVSDEAQHRARGSSAWKGALDIEISILPPKREGSISIIQRKSKDSEITQGVYVDLHKVIIEGWLDEDGEPVTSAVIVEGDQPGVRTDKKESALDGHRKTFENAWNDSGCEIEDKMPYVSRISMVRYLVTKLGFSESTAGTYVKPSHDGRLIAELLRAQIIQAHGDGWIVICKNNASAMLMTMWKS